MKFGSTRLIFGITVKKISEMLMQCGTLILTVLVSMSKLQDHIDTATNTTQQMLPKVPLRSEIIRV